MLLILSFGETYTGNMRQAGHHYVFTVWIYWFINALFMSSVCENGTGSHHVVVCVGAACSS